MNVISIIFSVLGSVVSGTALFIFQRYFKKKDARDEERDKAKARENVLTLKAINAVGKLTVANAIAIRDGKTNGELKDALTLYEQTENELFNYLLEQNANKN
jgi:uncharacterized membrane-anchored protein